MPKDPEVESTGSYAHGGPADGLVIPDNQWCGVAVPVAEYPEEFPLARRTFQEPWCVPIV